jgi:hypothetical protein
MTLFALLLLPVLVALSRKDLRYGFAAYAFSIPLSPELQFGPVANIRFEDFAALALLVAGGRRAAEAPDPSPRLSKAIKFWVGWSVFATLMGLAGGNDATLALTFLVKRVETALVFFMMLKHLRVRTAAAFVTTAALAGVAAAALWGYQQYQSVPVDTYYARATGPEDEPNVFAATLVMGLMVALALGLRLPRSSAKYASLGLAALCMPAILGTLSRAGYLSSVVGLAVMGLLGNRRLLVLVIALCATTSVLYTVRESLPRRVRTRLDRTTKERAQDERGGTFRRAWTRFAAPSPLWGGGLGCLRFRQVEGVYGAELAQGGVVGLGALLSVLGFLLVALRPVAYVAGARADPFDQALLLGCFCAVVTCMVHSLSGAALLAIRSSEAFWLWAALGLPAAARLAANVQDEGAKKDRGIADSRLQIED